MKPQESIEDDRLDEEEARDTIALSLPEPKGGAHGNVKSLSDLTGMLTTNGDLSAGGRLKPGRNKTVSDISDMILKNRIPDDERVHRKRQKSSSDVITKFGYAPLLGYADLKLAEQVVALGTRSERQESGLSQKDFHQKIDEKEEFEDFEFNHEGLTSEEAADRLAKYGPNQLPQKIDPKWLIFLRQFWAPMPIMIWIAIISELINIVMFRYPNFQTFVCVADTNSLLGYSVLTSLFPTTIFNIYI
jgi:magnesium-transporting ATPase (P-type)